MKYIKMLFLGPLNILCVHESQHYSLNQFMAGGTVEGSAVYFPSFVTPDVSGNGFIVDCRRSGLSKTS